MDNQGNTSNVDRPIPVAGKVRKRSPSEDKGDVTNEGDDHRRKSRCMNVTVETRKKNKTKTKSTGAEGRRKTLQHLKASVQPTTLSHDTSAPTRFTAIMPKWLPEVAEAAYKAWWTSQAGPESVSPPIIETISNAMFDFSMPLKTSVPSMPGISTTENRGMGSGFAGTENRAEVVVNVGGSTMAHQESPNDRRGKVKHPGTEEDIMMKDSTIDPMKNNVDGGDGPRHHEVNTFNELLDEETAKKNLHDSVPHNGRARHDLETIYEEDNSDNDEEDNSDNDEEEDRPRRRTRGSSREGDMFLDDDAYSRPGEDSQPDKDSREGRRHKGDKMPVHKESLATVNDPVPLAPSPIFPPASSKADVERSLKKLPFRKLSGHPGNPRRSTQEASTESPPKPSPMRVDLSPFAGLTPSSSSRIPTAASVPVSPRYSTAPKARTPEHDAPGQASSNGRPSGCPSQYQLADVALDATISMLSSSVSQGCADLGNRISEGFNQQNAKLTGSLKKLETLVSQVSRGRIWRARTGTGSRSYSDRRALEEAVANHPQRNSYNAFIRKHLCQALRITSLDAIANAPPPYTPKQVDDFIHKCKGCILITPDNFRLDFTLPPTHPINEAAFKVIAKDFVGRVQNHGWYSIPQPLDSIFLDVARVEWSFTKHFKHARDKYNHLVRWPETTIQRDERLSRAARRARKSRLYDSRLDMTSKHFPQHVDLLIKLGPQAVSSDESASEDDEDDGGVEPHMKYVRITPAWRSRRLSA
ncbi:hypothetical protein OF83DRAFT_1086490, partial [Amylostereum chailletii]